ncbi:MAG: TIGR02677 family protein [Conexibacteraceae bacterium]|nr:TIGR02677 family protein [Conexibacteraceae bacterium]
MTPQLSPALVRAAIELAGAAVPAEQSATSPASERLGSHQVLRYAVADEAETYRRIMRVLYLEHQSFGLRLRPAQVAARLRDRYALPIEQELLESRLARLDDWGAVEKDHDASLASTAAEWRRNRFTYDVTPAGRLTEELLAHLDALGEEIGRLDTARLPAIRDALANLAQELEADVPDGNHLRALFERLLAEVEALHAGALAFMRSLGDLMRAVERVGEDEFERGKGALLEHLSGFRKSRMRHSAEILALIERIEQHGPDRLVGTIVAAEVFVGLPGGATVEEQRAGRRAELLDRWSGLQAWFVGDQDSGSPWRTLNDQVIDAIRAVLAIAERLIERRSHRIDRAAVLLHLAARLAAAPAGEPTAWVRAAFGIRTPRHVGVPHSDDEQLADRGRVSWLEATPAPVVAHLRTPGIRTPGTGRGAQIRDLTEGRRRFEERRRAEHRELAELLGRLSTNGPIKLSSVTRVNEGEFRHLLAWIGRAYESPIGADGRRRAASTDGRAMIALREPTDPHRDRTKLRAPHGSLDLPDFELEVLTR